MPVSPYAGKPAEPSMLIDVPQLVTAYYSGRPDPAGSAQRVVFGTSGHRGSSLDHACTIGVRSSVQAPCALRRRW